IRYRIIPDPQSSFLFKASGQAETDRQGGVCPGASEFLRVHYWRSSLLLEQRLPSVRLPFCSWETRAFPAFSVTIWMVTFWAASVRAGQQEWRWTEWDMFFWCSPPTPRA